MARYRAGQEPVPRLGVTLCGRGRRAGARRAPRTRPLKLLTVKCVLLHFYDYLYPRILQRKGRNGYSTLRPALYTVQ